MKYYRKKNIKVDYAADNFQKCWTCKNACNGNCSWSRDFIPVDGWKAEKSVFTDCGEIVETYKIMDCPQYIMDRRY